VSGNIVVSRSCEGFISPKPLKRYEQKQKPELNSAKQISELFSTIEHRIMTISLNDIGGSALTDSAIDVPKFKKSNGIPITYVPARNTIFLSYAMAWAEVLECQDVFIGVNALDYSGYPDCRAEYISAFETMANLATKQGVEGQKLTIHTPLIDLLNFGTSIALSVSADPPISFKEMVIIRCSIVENNSEICLAEFSSDFCFCP
jgi:queuosine biosynthesis protein QueC